MANPSLVPNNTLSDPNDENRFVLFTNDWLNLQSYITSAMQLPIAKGDFTTKYGEFPAGDAALINGCVNAMGSVQELSTAFGNPDEIKKKIAQDPNYLGGATPPDSLYGHMIWLASQIHNQATTFSFTFENLEPLFQGTKEENAANLKMILTGDGGLTSTAQTASDQVGTLMAKLSSFSADFQAANDQLLIYTGSSSEILTAANAAVTKLQDLITKTQGKAQDAYERWEAFTIAAITVSVGIMVLSAGLLWPLAGAAGGGLGAAAGIARKEYNKLCGEIAKYQGQERQKSQLVLDLTGLNTSMIRVAPAMQKFATSMDKIQGVWTGINNNLLYIVHNCTVEQLGDYAWVMQAFKITDAQAKWKAIGQTTLMFTENSLVSYQTHEFGKEIAA